MAWLAGYLFSDISKLEWMGNRYLGENEQGHVRGEKGIIMLPLHNTMTISYCIFT